MRGMISSYVLVGLGLLGGLYVGVFVVDYEPQIVAWLFGAGAGLSIGAFIAAIATNTPLAGSAGAPVRRGVIHREIEEIEDPDPTEAPQPHEEARIAPPSRNGNGAGPGH